MAGHVLDHWDGILRIDGCLGDKRAYDPRAWGRRAEVAMARRVAEAAGQLGAAGRSLATGGSWRPRGSQGSPSRAL